jgi:hypothetical protein
MLTDNHPNFWNTLANWMQTKFTDEKYSALILYTTQEFGKSSGLATWNADSLLQRISFLEKVLQESEARFAVAISKNSKAHPPKSLQLQRDLLGFERRTKLEKVVAKYFIEAGSQRLPELHRVIKERNIKGIPQENQTDFLNSLIGFISHAEAPEDKQWEITYDDFSAKVADLNRIYRAGTYAFPRKYFGQLGNATDEEIESHAAHRFVEKIQEIEHHEVVPEAVHDYLAAVRTINEEFRRYVVPHKGRRWRTRGFIEIETEQGSEQGSVP